MTERSLDELGPVDYLVVEFPAGHQNFTGEGADGARPAPRRRDHPDHGHPDPHAKDADGDGRRRWSCPISPTSGELQRVEAQLAETLAEEDVAHLAAAMDPGSVAGVLIYENLWAAPFAAAMRHAGGQLIANGRIPIQALIAAVEADAALEAEGA